MEFSDKAAADSAWSKIGSSYNSLNAEHKETYEAYSRFYQRQFPGEIDPGDTTPAQLRDNPPPSPNIKSAGSEQGQSAGAPPAETTPELNAAFSHLAPQWGVVGSAEFQEHRAHADKAIQFASDEMLQRIDRHIGQDPQRLADLLWHAAKIGKMLGD